MKRQNTGQRRKVSSSTKRKPEISAYNVFDEDKQKINKRQLKMNTKN
jgi:hypothetical protein